MRKITQFETNDNVIHDSVQSALEHLENELDQSTHRLAQRLIHSEKILEIAGVLKANYSEMSKMTYLMQEIEEIKPFLSEDIRDEFYKNEGE